MDLKNILASLDRIDQSSETEVLTESGETIKRKTTNADIVNILESFDRINADGTSVRESDEEEIDEAVEDDVEESNEELANAPDEKIKDVDLDSGDDLHKKKKHYPKAQDGDNPIAAFEARLAEITADILAEQTNGGKK